MVIFQIKLSRRCVKSGVSQENLHKFKRYIQIVEGCDAEFDPLNEVPIDQSYMKSRFGFEMTPAEIGCFISHRRIWIKFSQCVDEWCLILEDDAIVDMDKMEITHLVKQLPNDWEVFFPYEAQFKKVNQKTNYEPYAIGVQWGAYAYFIHKRALSTLLSLVCRQPVDDELIDLCLSAKLKGIFVDTGRFDTDRSTSYIHKGRQKAIRDAMRALNCWSDGDKILMRKLLKIITTVGIESDIQLILTAGTLLGYVRHGKIIPWDDDFDVEIDEVDIDLFLSNLRKNRSVDFALFHEPGGCPFYKIWFKDGYPIRGHQHKWPFVDVWMFKKKGNYLVNDSNGRRGLEIMRNEYFPLRDVEFEGSPFFIPRAYLKILTYLYPTWRTKMRVFSYSHRYEMVKFHRLTVEIKVDKSGRLLE